MQSPQTKLQTHMRTPVLEPPHPSPVAVEGQPQNDLELAWKQYVGNSVPTKGSKNTVRKDQKTIKNHPKKDQKRTKKQSKKDQKRSKKVKMVKKDQK